MFGIQAPTVLEQVFYSDVCVIWLSAHQISTVLTWSNNQNNKKSEWKIVSGEGDSGLMVNALVDAVELNVVAQVVNGAEKNVTI